MVTIMVMALGATRDVQSRYDMDYATDVDNAHTGDDVSSNGSEGPEMSGSGRE